MQWSPLFKSVTTISFKVPFKTKVGTALACSVIAISAIAYTAFASDSATPTSQNTSAQQPQSHESLATPKEQDQSKAAQTTQPTEATNVTPQKPQSSTITTNSAKTTPTSTTTTAPQLQGYKPRTFDSPAEFTASTGAITLKAGSRSSTITAKSLSGAPLRWASTGPNAYIAADPEFLDMYGVVFVFDAVSTIGDTVTFHIETSPTIAPGTTYGTGIHAQDQATSKIVTKALYVTIE